MFGVMPIMMPVPMPMGGSGEEFSIWVLLMILAICYVLAEKIIVMVALCSDEYKISHYNNNTHITKEQMKTRFFLDVLVPFYPLVRIIKGKFKETFNGE